MRRSLFILIFFALNAAFLEAASISSLEHDVDREFSKFEIRPGLELKSKTNRRGLIYHQYPTLQPSLDFAFVSKNSLSTPVLYIPQIHFSFIGLSAHSYITENLVLEAGFEVINGSECLKLIADRVRDRTGRVRALEVSAGPKFYLKKWAQIALQFQRGFSGYGGFHADINTQLMVLDFDVWNLMAIGNLGWGDRSHNLYLYGNGATKGFSDASASLALEFPGAFFKTRWTASGTYTQLLNAAKKGAFTFGDHRNVIFGISVERSFRF